MYETREFCPIFRTPWDLPSRFLVDGNRRWSGRWTMAVEETQLRTNVRDNLSPRDGVTVSPRLHPFGTPRLRPPLYLGSRRGDTGVSEWEDGSSFLFSSGSLVTSATDGWSDVLTR